MYKKRKDGSESKRPKFLCEFCFNSDLHCQCFPWQCDFDWETNVLYEQSGESHVQFDVKESDTLLVSETVEFHDQASNWIFDAGGECDPSFNTTKNASDSLANFLARPALIYESDWSTTNASYSDSFNPWTRFFTNTAISAKITNYNNIRCKLHLKFLINGNAFLYGRAVAGYTPLPNDSDYPLMVTTIPNTVTRLTSRPHIFLDPTASQGGLS